MIVALVTGILIAFSVVAHELAHGYVALLEGDDTAQRAGRLTWNPLKHIDPVLTFALPIASWFLTGGVAILGGAKPVPVNPRRYRDGARSDVLVSLAGVTANALIALACAAGLALVGDNAVLKRVLLVNAALIVFNLLPIPPLDGWRIARCVARGVRAQRSGRAIAS